MLRHRYKSRTGDGAIPAAAVPQPPGLLTGFPPKQVRVHNQQMGGGLGRQLEVDFIAQAVRIAK